MLNRVLRKCKVFQTTEVAIYAEKQLKARWSESNKTSELLYFSPIFKQIKLKPVK